MSDQGLSDLLTVAMIAPWFIPLGIYTVIFFEWSARGRGEANVWPQIHGDGDDC